MTAMIVDSSGSRGAVVGAIRNAARATGVDFQYLLATAQVESGFNPTATVSTSSAKGLFQFIDQTWLATLKQAGPQLGYGRYANAITQTSSGTYTVDDPAMRREILALRDDPVANAAMAGAFTQQNAALLKDRIGRDASEGELYIAHFMGAGGGAQLINLAQENPGATAATAFPGAAKANPSIFYDRQGHARSAAEVYHVLVARYDVARATPTISAAATTPAAATPPANAAAPVMTTAQRTTPTTPPVVTVALPDVAETGPVFHSLFSDNHRQPVSQLVRDLWTSNPQVAAALTGQAGPTATAPATPSASLPPAQNGPMDLFSDRPADVRALFGERT